MPMKDRAMWRVKHGDYPYAVLDLHLHKSVCQKTILGCTHMYVAMSKQLHVHEHVAHVGTDYCTHAANLFVEPTIIVKLSEYINLLCNRPS